MPTNTTKPGHLRCRVCDTPCLYHELFDKQIGERGICGDCLLKEWRAMRDMLIAYEKEDKPRRKRRS
jgi:hypothetical protein